MLVNLSGNDDMITILADGINSQPLIGVHYLSLGTTQRHSDPHPQLSNRDGKVNLTVTLTGSNCARMSLSAP